MLTFFWLPDVTSTCSSLYANEPRRDSRQVSPDYAMLDMYEIRKSYDFELQVFWRESYD